MEDKAAQGLERENLILKRLADAGYPPHTPSPPPHPHIHTKPTCTQARARAHTQKRTLKSRACTHTYTNTHIYTYAYTHAHKHMHTHTHTCSERCKYNAIFISCFNFVLPNFTQMCFVFFKKKQWEMQTRWNFKWKSSRQTDSILKNLFPITLLLTLASKVCSLSDLRLTSFWLYM